VVIEIAGPDGSVVRRFASDELVPRPKAEIYFADLWLGTPAVPSARAGHNRFVWSLRYPAPRALEREYSMAAVPGRPWTANPQGAFVLRVRTRSASRWTARHAGSRYAVAMEPRVAVDAKELGTLLAFQREVEAALSRSAEQHETLQSAQEWLRAARDDPRGRPERVAIERGLAQLDRLAEGEDRPERVNTVLTSLATDLESADAAPTGPQRELLASSQEASSRFEGRFKAFASGALASLERRLAAPGLKAH
jgi:hypothetical protein